MSGWLRSRNWAVGLACRRCNARGLWVGFWGACAETGARCSASRLRDCADGGRVVLEADAWGVWEMAAEVRGAGISVDSWLSLRPGASQAERFGVACLLEGAPHGTQGVALCVLAAASTAVLQRVRCRRLERSSRRRGLCTPSPIPCPRDCGRGPAPMADGDGAASARGAEMGSFAGLAEGAGEEESRTTRAAGWCWSAGS